MKCRASRLRRSLVVAALACALLAARRSGGGETAAALQLQPSGETAAVPKPPNPQTRFPPLTTALRKSFAHHLLVNERFRLVLCAIPKVASTELIARAPPGDDAVAPRPHFRRDAPLFSRLKARDARRCLDDGNWTWAVFFRDPPRSSPRNNDLLLHRYDFIGSFERLAADAEALLRRLGAWDAYGRKGWGEHRSQTPIFAAAHAAKAKDAFTEAYADGALLARARRLRRGLRHARRRRLLRRDRPTRGAALDPRLCDLDPRRCAGD
ncbi:chondroitin 4-sulfotransferase [Aureococcus anophagefferens]|nr:chondroitin 4-sulfotransferase [Aureococcus anophagefferens]